MKTITRIIAVVCILFLIMPLQAQEKGSFLTLKGGLGSTGLQYELLGASRNGVRHNRLGWNAELGYQYFFTQHWGIAAGVGIAHYRTLGTYPFAYDTKNCFDLGSQVDDDGFGDNDGNYRLQVHLMDWKEIQKTYFVEIPLMVMYQHKFGERQTSGFYVGLGAKLQLPIISNYYVQDASSAEDVRLRVAAYYDDGHLRVGGEDDPQLPQHGFGGINDPHNKLDWEGSASLKLGVALSGEVGFLIGLSKRVDLMLAGFVDYGLMNIKKTGQEDPLLSAPEKYLPEAGENVGKGIVYRGMVESDRTESINPFAYGGKVGVRVKLGKLSTDRTSRDREERMAQAERQAIDALRNKVDALDKKMDALDKKVEKLLEQPQPPTVVTTTTPAKATAATFRGVVTDSATGDPLLATIEVYDEAENLAGVTASDANTGVFEVTDLPLGKTYSIKTKKPGYAYSVQEDINVGAEEETPIRNFNIKLSGLEKNSSFSLKNIFFETAKTTLKPESMKEIDNLYQLMTENPRLKIEVSGHTDNVGGYEYNQKLSKGRAAAVVQALINKGISAERLESAGYGYDRPVSTNSTPEGRAQNRRVEFKVLEN
ncbi:MAG: OmpA family protein [Bacteroidales bacterium]|nr:OmpA family protein [Bacteroidales bacterium]